jgi:hypothetical protein
MFCSHTGNVKIVESERHVQQQDDRSYYIYTSFYILLALREKGLSQSNFHWIKFVKPFEIIQGVTE